MATARLETPAEYLHWFKMQDALPTLQIRHSATVGKESWTVRATWEDGTFEEISGFQSETEANDWTTNKFQIWLEEVRKARIS